MARERNTEQKRRKTPPRSLFQSAPAQVMAPRLMVILSTLALLAIGLVMVYSSSSITSYVEEGDALGETLKQCVFALLGIGIAVFVALVAKQDAMQGTPGEVFWALCCVLILVTALLGTVGLGAKRWLIIGPISIQISEFAKIAFVMMAARIAAQYREGEIDSGFAAKLAIGMVILPLGFVFIAQSDMGTTMICCIGLFSVVVLSGLSGRATAVLVGLGIVFGFIAVLSKSYRADRLGSFADPWADAQGTGYQLVHSFKALASGGLLGAGIGNSYEKLQYLPEAETDFIFAIIGEELGLVGALLVIIAFLVVSFVAVFAVSCTTFFATSSDICSAAPDITPSTEPFTNVIAFPILAANPTGIAMPDSPIRNIQTINGIGAILYNFVPFFSSSSTSIFIFLRA